MKNIIIKKQVEMVKLENELNNLRQLENGTFNLDVLIREIKEFGIKSWDIVDGIVELYLKNEFDNTAIQSECKRVYITKQMRDQLKTLNLIF